MFPHLRMKARVSFEKPGAAFLWTQRHTLAGQMKTALLCKPPTSQAAMNCSRLCRAPKASGRILKNFRLQSPVSRPRRGTSIYLIQSGSSLYLRSVSRCEIVTKNGIIRNVIQSYLLRTWIGLVWHRKGTADRPLQTRVLNTISVAGGTYVVPSTDWLFPNLLKPKTYSMYHQLWRSEILRSAHNAFMCFVCISEQTGTISLYSINLSVFITEAERVYCAVRTGYLNHIDTVSSLKNLEGFAICR
jgi:hypothetical protein